MLAYVIRRLLFGLLTLFLVVSAIFAIFFVIPGAAGKTPKNGVSPIAVLLAGRGATLPEMRKIDHELGLDRPLWEQYTRYIGHLAQGDLGYSYSSGAPVWRIIKPGIAPTLSIVVGASALWVLAGVAVGAISARRRGSPSDRVLMALALAGLALPVFTVALVAIDLLFRYLDIVATNRYVAVTKNPVLWFKALWLPWVSLALPLVAIYARIVRTKMLEVGSEDYMRTAVAKGLDEKHVLRHQLRSSLTPIVTMYGLDVGILIGGSVIIERIFQIPGLGSTLLFSATVNDFPVIAGVLVLVSSAVVLLNLLADILYGVIDPRVRIAGRRTLSA